MLTIDILPDTAYQLRRVELDGTPYQLTLAWNGRMGAWVLSLATVDGVALVSGLTLVSNRPLLRRFRHVVGLPPGEFMATDLTGTIPAADYTQLGSKIELIYFEESEL